MNCSWCFSTPRTGPRSNPVLLNHAVELNNPATSQSTSQPESNSRPLQPVETRFIPETAPQPIPCGVRAMVGETLVPVELPRTRLETKGFAMNDAPPGYNECMNFPSHDVGSLPAYDEFSASLPAYEDSVSYTAS